MNYLMFMLLLVYDPYHAFKAFCNLVVTRPFLYDNYSFRKKSISHMHNIVEQLISRNCPKIYAYLKTIKVEMWTILWVEWVYAMFLRTFDLKTCLVFWDFALVKSEHFLYKLNLVVFQILDQNFEQLNKD